MTNTRTLSALALATLSLTLASCNRNNNASNGGAGSTLVVQESADIPTLDPGTTYDTSSGQVVENLYETLLTAYGRWVPAAPPLPADPSQVLPDPLTACRA